MFGCDKELVFVVIGMFENVDCVCEEIEVYIMLCIGVFIDVGFDSDFYVNGIDVCLDLFGVVVSFWVKIFN